VEAEEKSEAVKTILEERKSLEAVTEKSIAPVETRNSFADESKAEERFLQKKDEIFDNFYTESPDIHTVALEVEHLINGLFASACFDIEPVRVSVYDDETLFVEFNGADAALLIGKEGYRYKALAYLLYNWIHGRYGCKLRLEIAEFLQNQEAMIENYLHSIVERVENEGRGQTKVLDGILVQIALKRLREIFPNKYVAVRTNREGGRYIIINEFMERR
jgi:spoIIIJ-associated protein